MVEGRRLYTKYGDEGETSLLYGGRVSKANVHCEAYGATDETVSALGLARALSQDERVRGILLELERELFTVGAELATAPSRYDTFKQYFTPLSEEMTVRLEGLIDDLQAEVTLPRFVHPAGSVPCVGGHGPGAHQRPKGGARGGEAEGRGRAGQYGDTEIPEPGQRPAFHTGSI